MTRLCRYAVIAGSLFAFACSGCTKQNAKATPSVPISESRSKDDKNLTNMDGVVAEPDVRESTTANRQSTSTIDRSVREGAGIQGNSSGTTSVSSPKSPNDASGTTSVNEEGSGGVASGSVNRSAEASGKATSLDPRAAEARATRLIAEAEQAQQDGKTAKAYRFAVSAWEAVRVHKGDARCQELEENLLKTVQQLGEALNNNAASVDRRAPVTVK